MRTMNRVFLIGRLGQDPEIRRSQGGEAWATLSLATAVVAVGAGATLPARIGRIPRRP